MTNKRDGYIDRTVRLGDAQEETVGVPIEGFEDANGEYPSQEYYYSTSVNKAAKGEEVNKLSVGGGEIGVSLEVEPQKPSIFPLNQVQQTPSGHSFEMDDTPGGERVLIKHRTGAGIELRADGSVLISTKRQRVEVVGGDSKVIVEGEGDLVYKGNVNLRVDGDFNLSVGGNYNVNVAGDKTEEIKGRHRKTVNQDQNYTIRGARNEQVIGMASSTVLGERNLITKSNLNLLTEANTEILTGANLVTTAVSEWVAAASTANITGRHVSLIGHKGTIGGPLLDHYGKTYGGFPAGITNISTFYGTLVGKAAEAIRSDYSTIAGDAVFSVSAGKSLTAVTAKSLGAGPPPTPNVPVPGVMPYIPIPPTAPLPNPVVVELQLASSNYGIRNVGVSSKLRDKISKDDEYDGLFNHDPSMAEIRSKLRDPANFNNGKFTSYLVSQGKLNGAFKENIAPNIGRSADKKGTVRFGIDLLGNNPIENRSKRFKVNKQGIFGGFFD
jgi:hypothetical protein